MVTLRSDLPSAWAAATRGLGKLTITADHPGIVLTVLAAVGNRLLATRNPLHRAYAVCTGE